MQIFPFNCRAHGTLHESDVKSCGSIANGYCIEVAVASHRFVRLRNCKDPAGLMLNFTMGAWHAFVADVQQRSFDGH